MFPFSINDSVATPGSISIGDGYSPRPPSIIFALVKYSECGNQDNKELISFSSILLSFDE